MSMDHRNLTPRSNSCPTGSIGYTVGPGDSFYKIAGRLGTSVAVLTTLNPGVNSAALQVGQQICVPKSATGTTSPPCSGGITYTMQPGDTYYSLAGRYGLTVQALRNANPGLDPNRLNAGQTICIPAAPPPQPPALITTPLCSLLQPVLAAIPSSADIPIGSVTVRQVAMSTRAYTLVAAPLPDPPTLGNYNSYIGVLNLITDDPANPRTNILVHLIASTFGNQLPTWAGTVITAYPPIVGDNAEIRPYSNVTGTQGPALLRGDFTSCRS